MSKKKNDIKELEKAYKANSQKPIKNLNTRTATPSKKTKVTFSGGVSGGGNISKKRLAVGGGGGVTLKTGKEGRVSVSVGGGGGYNKTNNRGGGGGEIRTTVGYTIPIKGKSKNKNK
jgi:hypothetical protein